MPNFAILNNKTAFPNIQNLPWENEVPLRYYPEYGGSPIRHWCFLGEITQHIGFGRITVRVKDRAGKETTLAFYPETDEDVKGVKDIQEYQIGHTIAVLYPCRRQFLDMSTGIRLETMSNHEVKRICFFPAGSGVTDGMCRSFLFLLRTSSLSPRHTTRRA